MSKWLEYQCPCCKKWVEAVDDVSRCYHCGTANVIVTSVPCCLCEKTIKRTNLVKGQKKICEECKKEYKIR